MKRIIICLAVFLCLSSTYAFAANDYQAFKDFQLFTKCEQIRLVVQHGGNLRSDAMKNGLSNESIQNAAESRLRSANLYTNKRLDSYLFVYIHVVGNAHTISVQFNKTVIDKFTGHSFPAPTWDTGSIGTHGNDPGYILSGLSRHIDKFLVEFLRVNDEACRKKK